MNALQELQEILRQVGPKNIWRPVDGPDRRRLAEGVGHFDDGLPPEARLDFKDKTIADLGCNFGYYTFAAGRAGAAHVTGIDIDRRVIRGCRLLKDLYRAENVSFLAADITALDGRSTYDTAMMIDLIGKRTVAEGRLGQYLDVLEHVAQKEMILSIRPVYRIRKHLSGDLRALTDRYPGRYIRRNRFSTIDYVRDRFRDRWDMEIVSGGTAAPGSIKETLFFSRRNHGRG
jgi:SAM-dependent methyltransferase